MAKLKAFQRSFIWWVKNKLQEALQRVKMQEVEEIEERKHKNNKTTTTTKQQQQQKQRESAANLLLSALVPKPSLGRWSSQPLQTLEKNSPWFHLKHEGKNDQITDVISHWV